MYMICIKKCTFRNRLWTPGETLVSVKDEKVPKHFKQEKDLDKKEAKLIDSTPKTMRELQKEMDKDEIKQKKAQEKARLKKEEEIKKAKSKKKEKEQAEAKAKMEEDAKKDLEAVGHGEDKEEDFLK